MAETPDTSLTPDARKMLRRLSRLVEISVTLNSTLELASLLEYILTTATELLNCEAVSILLYDETLGQLRFAAATGTNPEELDSIFVPLETSLAGTIFKENRPLVINNVAQDVRHYSEVGVQMNFPVASLVGVPMCIREHQVGVLEAINKNTGAFTKADTKLLSIIASQAAVAIHNAQLVQDLQAANAELLEADAMKTRFMAVASHELRTPLGIILGYATFVKEEAQGELSDHANNLLNAALQLRSLVEDMTNMNLLHTGQRDVHLEPVPLHTILQQAYQEIASTAEAKNDTLILDFPEAPVIVNADIKLKLVFVNLLNNAVRFTANAGKILVRLSTQNGEALVQIQDDGIGIPPEKLDKLFDQFYQVEDHETRRYGGLGLGLSIARALVKLHGGRIWAESEGLGQGATFWVALPLANPEQ